jgi:hypothetical protein
MNVIMVTWMKPVSTKMTAETLMAAGRCMADVTQVSQRNHTPWQRISSLLWIYGLPNFNFFVVFFEYLLFQILEETHYACVSLKFLGLRENILL